MGFFQIFMAHNYEHIDGIMYCPFLVILLAVSNNEARLYNKEDAFTINTEGCKILGYPLINEQFQNLLTPPAPGEINCTYSQPIPPLVKANSTHIWVVKKSYPYYDIEPGSEFYCCYRNFTAQGNLEFVAYGICQDFTNNIKGKDEFVRVECFKNGEKVYDDLFRMNVYERMTPKKKYDDHSFSIVMFGIDSISRKNFARTMPKTSSFLKSRGSIPLYGYNAVGENSYPNLFPIFTGKSFPEAKESCFSNNEFNTEACTFIWDMFKKAGYHTAMGSDSGIGIFDNYESLLPYKPTDFYLQTYMFQTKEMFSDPTYDYHICMRGRFVYKELLKFALDVLNSVRHNKFFGVFWEQSVSHHNINFPNIMDSDYLSVLREMEKKKDLEDTIVIFFSDHGTRYGEYLTSEEGRQETRLPLLEVLFPLKFRRKYKTAFKNFELNSRRLTTPFNLHQTLIDLINMPCLEDQNLRERINSLVPGTRLQSLFLPVPTNITCKSAHIPEHYCTCIAGNTIPVSPKAQVFTAKYLLRHINQIVGEKPQCYQLSIKNIVDVTATKDDDGQLRVYRVLLQTKPGGALFQGTLVQDHKVWTVSDVSRLNSYKNQSLCVKDPAVKTFCNCRKQKLQLRHK